MILKLCGAYLIIDGVASLLAFRGQAWYAQLVRIGRTLIGIILLFL